ncbi:MAG: toll/interleukin-1 receptor domain-containing protein, partial [Clostridia bacterium]|nr:toll/interleukin-1 receptor domain-containing protein [Clostridia bacterium]
MAVFKCTMCGGALEINAGESVAVCEYCNTKQTLPRLDDEKRTQLYDRANYFRRENEFDKAMGIYEMILSDDKEDCESYWGIVLCRYGIEYVEDPRSHKRIPTVNRAQFTSVFEDENYKNAIKYADALQKEVYESEATVIDKIQRGILAISQREEPFDIFICYKETDSLGNRTQDSVYAQDIYTALTKEGYKVFFAKITLEDKLGSAYEPYIFAALNSAKVMLVVGTSKENFNAVWVKNEWSRFLSLIKQGKEKTLIPVYRDIIPYDMPEEFQYLQSQDMGKIGFMQDLLRGIGKLVEAQKPLITETVVVNSANSQVEPLLKRAFMF